LSFLEGLAQTVLQAAGAGDAGLSLVLVGDRFMRHLNRLYRQEQRSTDVLAFPGAPLPCRTLYNETGQRFLGDVVISLPYAARQAQRVGHSLQHELAVLVTHGVLHLLGYDHERSARDAQLMQRKERAILRILGKGLATAAACAKGTGTARKRPKTDRRKRLAHA
jgi:rRNA maturation RNase YbeY